MRFAPQRQKLLQHLNFQERSENGLLFTCWLRNVLRASRHNGVQFLISHLPRWLRTRRFFWLFLFFSSDSFSYLIALSSSCPSVNIVGSLTSKLLSTSYKWKVILVKFIPHMWMVWYCLVCQVFWVLALTHSSKHHWSVSIFRKLLIGMACQHDYKHTRAHTLSFCLCRATWLAKNPRTKWASIHRKIINLCLVWLYSG